MNEQQLSQIQEIIIKLKKINVNDIISDKFKDINNITNQKIDYLNVNRISALFNRLITQLENELEGENNFLYPFQYNYNNEFGGGSLSLLLNNMLSALSNKDLQQFVMSLRTLAYYELINGFYDKPKKQIEKNDYNKIQETNDKLRLMADHLLNYSNNSNLLIKNLENQKENLNQFKVQKENELKQILNSLNTANAQTNQISELLNNATKMHSKLESIYINQQQKSDEYQKMVITLKDTIQSIEIQKNQIIKDVDFYHIYIEEIQKKKSFFDERNNYLNELIGREVGVSLFSTFQQRKIELESSLNFWKWAVPITSIITVISIYAIFTNFFGLLNGKNTVDLLQWKYLVTNSLKTIPFFILLYFSIKQYNKERIYQEEYAFKSAVALTINAYADIIKKDDLKDDLIIKSVENVFKNPVTSNKINQDEMKDITETIKNVSSAVKDITQKST